MTRVILLAILFIVVARIFWRVFDGVIAGARSPSRSPGPPASAVKLVRDPVCGTFVTPGTALSLTASGSTHYFCSDACRESFRTGAA
jgi:YHS domain-containing protein